MADDLRESHQHEPSKQLGIRVPYRIAEELERLARAENNGVSAICRRLLTSALDERRVSR
jgi:hypothetical protein